MSTRDNERAIAALAAVEVLHEHTTNSHAEALNETERDALRSFAGWGALARLFASRHGDITDVDEIVVDRIRELIGEGAFNAIADQVDTSFYTPDWLTRLMWGILTRAGFTSGRVLEPGCGHGRFFATAPAGADLIGIDPDPVASGIARLLYPTASVHTDKLENVSLRNGSIDAVIGNVPFSRAHVYDRASEIYDSLHNYVVKRCIQLVRDGGYLVLLTSRHTLDALVEHDFLDVELVAAVRLPSSVFTEEGTSTVTDLLVLRRTRGASLAIPTDRRGFRSHSAKVSTWFTDNPHLVAGNIEATGYYQSPFTVTSDNPERDVQRAIDSAAALIDAHPMSERGKQAGSAIDPYADLLDRDGHLPPEGSFTLHEDGTVTCITRGKPAPVKATAELRHLIRLRDAATALFDAEANDSLPDHDIDPIRGHARALWEQYVSAHGPLNRGTLHEGKVDPDAGTPTFTWRRPAMGGFRRDPKSLYVMALEVFDQDTQSAHPAAILTRRVHGRPTPVERAANAADALAITLGEYGRIAEHRIAELLDITTDGVADALGNLAFRDPSENGRLVPARDYLSGAVRVKLRQAEQAAHADAAYQRNVDALQDVQPTDVAPADIRVAPGAPWISADDMTSFIRDTFGIRYPTVEHSLATASWSVSGSATREADITFGTPRMSPVAILECAMNRKTPVVWDTDSSTGRKTRNHEQSVAAIEKMATITTAFEEWVWADAQRAERIARDYNDRFNAYVPRRSDGSHLTFPGLSSDVQLWEHQRNAVEQVVSTPASFIAHAVGAGKTYTAICAAMTLRQFGIARKPLIVVPNHLLEQVATSALHAYPTGRFLIATKDDLAGESRRFFAARCASGEWDAVVMTHSAFGSIPVDPDTEASWMEDRRSDLRESLRDDSSGFTSKEIARKIRGLDARLNKLRDTARDPRAVIFEHLGIDHISIDEAHLYKRLDVGAGRELNMGASKRATDLLMKIEHVRGDDHRRPHVAFYSGTPWTNSLVETFVWQQYLQPRVLRAAGIGNLDAWAGTFVDTETNVEVAPDGSGFRYHTRPARLTNVHELRAMFGMAASVLPSSALPVAIPEHETHVVTVQPSAWQVAFVQGLAARAENIRTRSVNREKDNMLAICGDGRRVALDPALVGCPGDSPKLAEVARTVARVWREHRDVTYADSDTPGAFHLVFCDQGTPNPGDAQSYGRLRAMLVSEGVPAGKIRFMHEAKTDKAKAALFAACRDGRVAVLIGSTETCGFGTNVQTRLRTIHHVDAPWRPSDIQQRDGRAVRPGNANGRVDSYRYVTERTFDAYMWQTIARKSVFIDQMMTTSSRTVDDISEHTMSYQEVKAAASGNPLLLQQAKLHGDVRRLRALRSVDRQSLNAARHRIADYPAAMSRLGHRIDMLKESRAEILACVDKAAVSSALSQWSRFKDGARVHVSGAIRIELDTENRRYIDVLYRHSRVGRIDRGRSSAGREATIDCVFAWAKDVDGHIVEAESALVSMREDQSRDEAIVATYRFSREEELREAEHALAVLEGRIAAEAEAA